MAQAPTRKDETHERIVRVAARAIRAHGYGGIGVADIMKEAGLTHGGFYAHFASKAALLAEAADRAGAEGVESLGRVAASVAPDAALATLVDAYLSDVHLHHPELGCPVAALGSETHRQEPEVRSAATRRIKDMIGLIERQMPGWGEAGNRDKAMAILACLVGTLVIARGVDDLSLSKAMRRAARQLLESAAAPTAAPSPTH